MPCSLWTFPMVTHKNYIWKRRVTPWIYLCHPHTPNFYFQVVVIVFRQKKIGSYDAASIPQSMWLSTLYFEGNVVRDSCVVWKCRAATDSGFIRLRTFTCRFSVSASVLLRKNRKTHQKLLSDHYNSNDVSQRCYTVVAYPWAIIIIAIS
jgi:hypothetical protein